MERQSPFEKVLDILQLMINIAALAVLLYVATLIIPLIENLL